MTNCHRLKIYFQIICFLIFLVYNQCIKVYNKLITKSCYFVKPCICNKLYEDSKTFKLQIKYFLSKFIDDNKDINVYFYNKNTLIEGTKIGIQAVQVQQKDKQQPKEQ